MSRDEDRLGAVLVGGAQGHRGVDAELAGRVGGCRNHAALIVLASDDNGFASQRGIVQFFH